MLTSDIGYKVEQLVSRYLQKKAFQLIGSNFRCKVGELDLIMKDQEYLVFIEVRYRAQEDYGSGLESIHYYKQRRIIKAAQLYLQCHAWAQNLPCRLDVVSVSGPLEAPKIHWVPNAFTL